MNPGVLCYRCRSCGCSFSGQTRFDNIQHALTADYMYLLPHKCGNGRMGLADLVGAESETATTGKPLTIPLQNLSPYTTLTLIGYSQGDIGSPERPLFRVDRGSDTPEHFSEFDQTWDLLKQVFGEVVRIKEPDANRVSYSFSAPFHQANSSSSDLLQKAERLITEAVDNSM